MVSIRLEGESGGCFNEVVIYRPAFYNFHMIRFGSLFTCGMLTLLWGLWLSGCATDIYRQRAELVMDHSKAFYKSLERGQVAGAVTENEQIEGLARDMERGLIRRSTSMDTNQKAREWSLIKTTNQTAIDNWLNLGRYLSQTKRYDQARGTYQRVVDTYQDKGAEYASAVDRARLSLKDVDSMLAPANAPRP